jgi:AbiV family abortive infection protein
MMAEQPKAKGCPPMVTPEYLLKGAAYALEQCGLLLQDANLLYRNGSYASAVALAAFAREELGRWRILLGLRKQVLNGDPITIKDIKGQCDKHVRKQEKGMLSVFVTTHKDTALFKQLPGKPRSEEWKAALNEQVKKLHKQRAKRLPNDRHEQRMSALYVGALASGWNRPKEISQASALECFWEAVQDYSSGYDHYTNNNPTPLELPRPETLAAGIDPPWPLEK